jgi:phenylpropionate dioxygenase-like ring-hydroxylating dioxygenase large terminal subunit
MTPWPAEILSRWFVLARADAVSERPQAIMLFGRPVAVARLGSGRALALEDRCPHRHAPLSAGAVDDAGLRCPYHGWTFGADGRCTRLPGLDAVGDAAPRTKSFDVIERDGLLWAAPSRQTPVTLPRLVLDTDPAQRRFLWQTLWNAPAIDCLENFLDAMHTHYVHAGLVRRAGERRPVKVTLATSAEGFAVDYEGTTQQSGLLYRLFESERISERAVFAAPGTAQIEYRYRDGSTVRITLHFTPATQDTTHVFTTLHVGGRWAPAWAVRLFVWPFLRRVAMQDARMLTLQTATRARFGDERYASTRADIVRPYLEAVWCANRTELPATRSLELMI